MAHISYVVPPGGAVNTKFVAFCLVCIDLVVLLWRGRFMP